MRLTKASCQGVGPTTHPVASSAAADGTGSFPGAAVKGPARRAVTIGTSSCRTGTAAVSIGAPGKDPPPVARRRLCRAVRHGTTTSRRAPSGAERRTPSGRYAPLSNGTGRTGTSGSLVPGTARPFRGAAPSSKAAAIGDVKAKGPPSGAAKPPDAKVGADPAMAGTAAACRVAGRSRNERT